MRLSNIEVLVSTMYQNPSELYLVEKMNIKTDAIIINQTDSYGYIEKKLNNDANVKMYSFNEKGVGKSRNNALLRANKDICLMADDDVVYVNNYEQIIQKAYLKYPDADFIVFNVRIHEKGKTSVGNYKEGRVKWYNSLRYGTVRFSFKRKSVLKENIFFSLLFGGGAKYGSGEDSLFIWEALKRNLNVYVVNDVIADVYNDESSWFEGYNEKFFMDKGALYKALSSNFYMFFSIRFLLKNKKKFNDSFSFFEKMTMMKKGAFKYSNLR